MAKKNNLYPLEAYTPPVTNLLHLCGVRKCSASVPHINKTTSYYSMQEVTTNEGVKLVINEEKYPITADFVKSFESSANYKNDTASALASQPIGHNLGDLTAVQSLSNSDVSKLRELLTKLSKSASTSSNASTAKVDNNISTPIESEVNN